MPYKKVKLPFLHPSVDLEDLHKSNRKLLSENEISALENFLKDKSNGRYRKKSFVNQIPNYIPKYGIIKLGKDLFIVYKGVKSRKAVYYNGENKKVKLVQNAQTGAWFVLKIGFSPLPPVEVVAGDGANGLHYRAHSNLNTKFKQMTNEINKIILLAQPKLSNVRREIITRTTTAIDKRWPGYSLNKVSYSFLMPMLSGVSIEKFLEANYKLPDFRWAELGVKILSAIRDFHQKKFLHRDIKEHNVIFDLVDDEVTVVDLEFTQKMDDNREYVGEIGLSGTGTYLAPELINDFQQAKTQFIYNEYTEAYAAGILLKILFGIPVHQVTDLKTFSKLKPGEEIIQLGSARSIGTDTRIVELVNRMTSDNPHERLKLIEADAVLFDDAIRTLTAIQNRMSKSVVKTAVIELENILDYYHRATPIQKSNLLSALQQFDEICLVNVTKTANKDYYYPLLNIQRVLYQNRYKEDGSSDELADKIPCFSDLLVMKDIKELIDINANINDPSVVLPKKTNPSRTFTYFDASLCVKAPDQNEVNKQHEINKYLLEHGINVVVVEKEKTRADYLKNIAACDKKLSRNDYQFITHAIEKERDRLQKKYKVKQYSRQKQAGKMNAKLDLVEYRFQKLDEALISICNLRNVNLSYAAVTQLLTDMQADAKFATRPRSFFAFWRKQAKSVSNVEKMRKEVELRMRGNHSS